MAEITLRAAREELEAWKQLRDRLDESRDETVARAIEAGVSKIEICRITRIARTTIDRIAAARWADRD